MQQIRAVTSACEIEIEPGILRVQPVVREIIDPAETERWTEVTSFRGVIIDHVENHFDISGVQAAHHRLELGDLWAHLPAAGIVSMRSEKGNGVVTPVIR